MEAQRPYWENSDYAEDEEEEGYVPDEELFAAAQLPPPPPLPPTSRLTPMDEELQHRLPSRPIMAYHLGRERYAVLSKFMGQPKLHIREFGTNAMTGVKYPTPKGVALDHVQTRSLMSYINDIRSSVHAPDAMESSWHLGRLVFGSFNPEFGQRLDLRHFFVPENEKRLQATRKGISLNRAEMDILTVVLLEKAETVWPALRTFNVACFVQHTEHNDEERAKQQCEYCAPLMNI